jgi:hypothetical protein
MSDCSISYKSQVINVLVCLFPGLIAGIVVCIYILIGLGVAVFLKMRNKVSGYDII